MGKTNAMDRRIISNFEQKNFRKDHINMFPQACYCMKKGLKRARKVNTI